MMDFNINYNRVLNRISTIDPVKYGKTRNFIDGDVTYLSPYISRGFISVKQVLDIVLQSGCKPFLIKTFIQELAWRDYWQLKWKHNRNKINDDLNYPQPMAKSAGIPVSMLHHNTGIDAIDNGISILYDSGYMHNHIRMYVASVACNVAKCHWKIPAQWMYYHLLDADWGSNALSWQWICGTTREKLYHVNQENINKYGYTNQTDTFLDSAYDDFPLMKVPEVLEERTLPELITILPETNNPVLDDNLPTLIYNFYNVDPNWKKDINANRILLLEPSVFTSYPVSPKSIEFCIALATENIPGIQVWVAEFPDVQKIAKGKILFKEHPLNLYSGSEEPREWLTDVKGDFNSFFGFWKKCEKLLI